jgi:hypothetical protein
MLLLNESKIDFLVRHRRVIMITGLVIMVLPFALGLRFGLLSGFMLFSLGVYCSFFRNWRSERFMDACLFANGHTWPLLGILRVSPMASDFCTRRKKAWSCCYMESNPTVR